MNNLSACFRSSELSFPIGLKTKHWGFFVAKGGDCVLDNECFSGYYVTLFLDKKIAIIYIDFNTAILLFTIFYITLKYYLCIYIINMFCNLFSKLFGKKEKNVDKIEDKKIKENV